MKKFLSLAFVPLLLTGCSNDTEPAGSTSATTEAATSESLVMDPATAFCGMESDGSFMLLSADVLVGDDDTRTMQWNFDGEVPAEGEVSFGAMAGDAVMGVKLEDGEVSSNYWMKMGEDNHYSETDAQVLQQSVTTQIPDEIAAKFGSSWSADLSVDGQRVITCHTS